jgi:hypothetical protein
MYEITYRGLFVFITLIWIAVRVICNIKKQKVDWKQEAKLLLPCYIDIPESE